MTIDRDLEGGALRFDPNRVPLAGLLQKFCRVLGLRMFGVASLRNIERSREVALLADRRADLHLQRWCSHEDAAVRIALPPDIGLEYEVAKFPLRPEHAAGPLVVALADQYAVFNSPIGIRVRHEPAGEVFPIE